MKFDIDKFNNIENGMWHMDNPNFNRLTIPEEDFHALVGIQDVYTQEWLWIRKDFKKKTKRVVGDV